MRPILRILLSAASSLLVAAIPIAAPASATDEARIATGEVAGTILTVSPRIAFESAILRVTGPADYEAIAWSEGGSLTLDLSTEGVIPASDGMPGGTPQILPDGRYGFEVVFWLPDGSHEAHDGEFSVENGAVMAGGAGRSRERFRPALPRGLTTSEGEPGLTNVVDEAGSTEELFAIVDGNNDGETHLQLSADDSSGSFINAWAVRNQNGDLRLETSTGGAWDHHFSFKPSGRMGIGTTQPQADLHIYRPGGNIRITDSDACPNANAAWEIEEDFGRLKFEVVSNCPGDLVGGKMWIHGTGNIGIGTNEPANSLHISRPYPAIRITDSDPCPNPSASWLIDQVSESLRFGVVTKCSGDPAGTKMVIHGSGNVGIGTASPAAKLHVMGGGIIEGDVALGSSRTIKHEIEPLDGSEILSAIRELPVYAWKYKDDPVQAAHVGPMAEDVHAAFRLGRDEKHLSPSDSAGLALAGLKGIDERLDRELDELRVRNAELAAANESLLERLTAMEERLSDALAAIQPSAVE